jgi:hypothetical protein
MTSVEEGQRQGPEVDRHPIRSVPRGLGADRRAVGASDKLIDIVGELRPSATLPDLSLASIVLPKRLPPRRTEALSLRVAGPRTNSPDDGTNAGHQFFVARITLTYLGL